MQITHAGSDRSRNGITFRALGKAKGRVFDYYFIQGVKGSSFPSPAYLLKAVDAEEGEIEFKRVDMGK